MEPLHELQDRLGPVWALNRPGCATEHVVVVLPSLNMSPTLLRHYGLRLLALEHRYLTEMLMLARVPGCELVFVCSEHPGPGLVDYYASLVPAEVQASVRARVHVVSVDERSARPVAEKLLESPRALSRVSEIVAGRPAMIEPWNVMGSEAAVAQRLGLPMNGTPADLWPLGFKSAGRRIFRDSGVPVPLGSEDVRNLDDIAEAITTISRAHPRARGVVVKHDNSGAGEGNLVMGIRDRHGRALSGGVLQRLLDEAVPEWYRLDLAAGGGVVEELVSGASFTSPSAQVDVAPDGAVEVVATHEQVLSGDSSQVYAGCTFPANPDYSAVLASHAAAVGSRLAELGARGRLSVDFVAVKDGCWDVMAIEVNLRKGGTTHPLTTLRNLVPGHYEAGTGTWVADDGTSRCYSATDNLLDPTWLRLRPEAAIEAVASAGLAFDGAAGAGVVLHMLSGLAIDGRCGLTAIGRTPEEAHRLAQDAQQAIAVEGERAQGSVVGGPA
jgi:hypothetical protein